MTAPVSSLARALHLLRVELTQTPQGRVGAAQARRARTATEVQAMPATAVGALRAKLRAARAQPGGLTRGKALRLFIEAALLDELGSELQLDPAFADLVERTCQAIEQDEGSASLLAAAMDDMATLG